MRKTSIQRKVARYFILMIALVVIFLSSMEFYENFKIMLDISKEQAISCSEIVSGILDHVDFKQFEETPNSEKYDNERNKLRNVCISFDLDYLYIYSIDSETMRRRRLFNVAYDDKMDAYISVEHSFGTLYTDPLNPKELAIFNGARKMQRTEFNNKYGHEITWLIPYTNENNELLAIIGIDNDFNIATKIFMKMFLLATIPTVAVMILELIILLKLIGTSVVSPLKTISEKMLGFANDSEHKPETLNINTNDEIGEIAASFDKMVNDISIYMKNIESLTKERLENQVQLEVARHIQYGLVPEKKEINNQLFSVSAVTSPAKEVGGDFYDCFQRIDGTMCIMIGDVSGKGITAAIFMAMTKTMLREKLMSGCSPAQALNQANDELCAQNPENLFVTVFVAILDSDTGKICYANAGHTKPVILKDEPQFLTMEPGMALGMFEDAGLKDETLQLNAHQGILLYTDGVTEALDKDNHFFGTQRLHDAVLHNCAETDNAIDTVNRVLNDVHNFSAGKEQFDDTAILAAYFKTLSAKQDEVSLPLNVSSIEIIKKIIFEMLGQNPLSRKIILACDEVLANIVNYSGADQLTFGCEKEDSLFRVHFTDNGTPFDPTAEQPQEKDFDMLDMGGMGLNMIRQTAENMTYNRDDDKNCLTLEFTLG